MSVNVSSQKWTRVESCCMQTLRVSVFHSLPRVGQVLAVRSSPPLLASHVPWRGWPSVGLTAHLLEDILEVSSLWRS